MSGKMMARLVVSNEDRSVPLFKNLLLDALTRVRWYIVPLFWLPVIAYSLAQALGRAEGRPLVTLAGLAAGLALWTIAEYILHRFVFHFEPSLGPLRRLHYLMHGVHHDYPKDSRRLVMPPWVAVILACPFIGLFRAALGPGALFFSVSSGFLTGYLIYDMIHYALHHAPLTHPAWLLLKQHHMRHHYRDPSHNYGVSSTLWDIVFRSTGQTTD
ncbi:MAG: sterol desaturase family protein [Acidobacteriota bacterium]